MQRAPLRRRRAFDRVEHDADPEPAALVAQPLIETKQLRIERRRRKQIERTGREFEAMESVAEGDEGGALVEKRKCAKIAAHRPSPALTALRVVAVERGLLDVDPIKRAFFGGPGRRLSDDGLGVEGDLNMHGGLLS